MNGETDKIVLLAKQSGQTSFSALWQVKNALKIKKVGHTGTLDTFADGLLVVLSGRLTRLAPYITATDKVYEALLSFGSETDTLDPDGTVVRTAALPTLERLQESLSAFTGPIMQIPPVYSALHIAGQRSSDLARAGVTVAPVPRPVIIHSLQLISTMTAAQQPAAAGQHVVYAKIAVSCSKGTYIRSLARDIGNAAGSCASLAALRRTKIGNFSLEKAAGYALLEDFGKPVAKGFRRTDRLPADTVISTSSSFTPQLSDFSGLQSRELLAEHIPDFFSGQTIRTDWFAQNAALSLGEYTVFSDSLFLGMIAVEKERIRYIFVAGEKS